MKLYLNSIGIKLVIIRKSYGLRIKFCSTFMSFHLKVINKIIVSSPLHAKDQIISKTDIKLYKVSVH